MTRSASEIVKEIQQAAAERHREYGRNHAITEWPLPPNEWDVLVAEVSKQQCLWPDQSSISAHEMTLSTQFGDIKIRKGPK